MARTEAHPERLVRVLQDHMLLVEDVKGFARLEEPMVFLKSLTAEEGEEWRQAYKDTVAAVVALAHPVILALPAGS